MTDLIKRAREEYEAAKAAGPLWDDRQRWFAQHGETLLSHVEAQADELANITAHYETAQANWDLTLDRAEKAESALVVAREALERIAGYEQLYTNNGIPVYGPSLTDEEMNAVAKDALAKLNELDISRG
jgi:hypothetical protein